MILRDRKQHAQCPNRLLQYLCTLSFDGICQGILQCHSHQRQDTFLLAITLSVLVQKNPFYKYLLLQLPSSYHLLYFVQQRLGFLLEFEQGTEDFGR